MVEYRDMTYHIDSGILRSPRTRADGVFVCDGLLTRSGVFSYRNPDGSVRRTYRPPGEVFDAESLASFGGVVVTNDHPDKMVDATNLKDVTVGMVDGTTAQTDDHVMATLRIFDEGAIALIKAGKQELSCGYYADVVPEVGVSPEGEHYDTVQKNIRGNHVAIVKAGRAGPTARIYMDSAVQTQGKDEMELTEALKKLAEVQGKCAVLQSKFDSQEGDLKALKDTAAKLEAERDSAKDCAEKTAKAHKDAQEALQGVVQARVELQAIAAPVLDTDDLSKMTDREIKTKCIDALTDRKMEGKSDVYVDAYFDSVMDSKKAADGSLGKVQSATRDYKETEEDDGFAAQCAAMDSVYLGAKK